MKRLFKKVPTLLLSIILSYQIIFPVTNVFAAYTDNNILPPSNLTHQMLTPDDVKLTWNAVYGAVSYNIYAITEGQLKQVATTTGVSYTFNNQAEGNYTYVVSTNSSLGESGPGAPISITVDYPDMLVPKNLTSTIKNGNDVLLTWDLVQYAENYKIYSVNENGQYTLLATTPNKIYSLTNVVEGAYKYAVLAENSLYGTSELTDPIDVNIVYPIMEAPKNVNYTITNTTDVNFKWDVVNYATSYNIYLVNNDVKVLKGTSSTNSFKIINHPGGDYKFEINSVSSRFGESSQGSLLNVTVSDVVMAPPANFAYKIQNVNDVVLTWSPALNATNYKIYQVYNDGEKVLKSTVSGTSVTYTNLPAGNYAYEIYTSSTRFGDSSESSQVSLNVESFDMINPENLNFDIINGNDIKLTWGAVPYATGYRIYQLNNGQKVLKSYVTGTAATYSNLAEGDYSYIVHSYSSKFGESKEGAQVDVSLVHPVMEPPGNPIQTIKTISDFSLSWDASPYATSYKVYQIIDGNKVLKKTSTSLNATFIGMTPGEYNYEIYSYSSRFGESEIGSQISVILNGEIMLSPENFNYSFANTNDLTLSWSAVPYATSYKVYEVVDGIKILKSTVTTTTAKYTNIRGGNYTYVVHSVSKILGESPEGAEVSFDLVLPDMQPPTELTSKVQNGNDVVLTWLKSEYATTYKVYELIEGELKLKGSPTGLTFTMTNQSEGTHTYVVHSYSTRFGESLVGSNADVSIEFPEMLPPENLTYTILNGMI